MAKIKTRDKGGKPISVSPKKVLSNVKTTGKKDGLTKIVQEKRAATGRGHGEHETSSVKKQTKHVRLEARGAKSQIKPKGLDGELDQNDGKGVYTTVSGSDHVQPEHCGRFHRLSSRESLPSLASPSLTFECDCKLLSSTCPRTWRCRCLYDVSD